MAPPKGPYRLVTVNTAPERAKVLIGRVAEALKEEYTIDYVANCESKEEVESKVREFKADIIFSASMWTAEDAAEIQNTARSVNPEVKAHAIPFGLQVVKGPDAIVAHLLEEVPKFLG